MRNSIIISQKFTPNSKKEVRPELVAIKKKGINLVRFELNWHDSEPKYESYDFSKTLEIVKYAEELNLTLELLFHFETPPSWLLQEASLSNINYSPYLSDHPVAVCWEHPLIQKTAERFLKAALKILGKSTAISSWAISRPETIWENYDIALNQNACTCKHSIDAFREYLKARYKSIDIFNKKVNLNFASWDHIFPNTGINPLALEWSSYNATSHNIVLDTFVDIISKNDKQQRSVTITCEPCLFKDTSKDYLYAQLISKSLSKDTSAWNAEISSATSPSPLWVLPTLSDDSLQNATYSSLALSPSKILFSHSPSDSLTNIIKSSDALISKCDVEPSEVAIIASLDSALLCAQSGSVAFVQNSIKKLSTALLDRSVFPDLLLDFKDQNLAKYKVVFLASPILLETPQIEAVKGFVSAGGKVLSEILEEVDVAGLVGCESVGFEVEPIVASSMSDDKFGEVLGVQLDAAAVKNLDLRVIVQSHFSQDFWVLFVYNKVAKTTKFVLDETEGYELVDSFGCHINEETFKITIEPNAAGCVILKASNTPG
ncbi:MAG: beta-galactosidase [Bacillota bacterium]